MAADPMTRRYTRARGFSLIELMITVAILAIIAMVAIPSYQENVIKSRRSDGQIALNLLAQRLERCQTQFGRYDAADCVINTPFSSPEGYYSLTIVARNANSYTLSAEPVGPQVRDTACATLTVNNFGQRTASGTQADKC